MQGSDAGRLRDPRVPRIPPVGVLVCWALGALVFAFLPPGSEAKPVIATVFSLSTASFAAGVLLQAAPRAEGHERAFLRLMGLGMVFRLAGNSLWSASQHLGLGIVTPVALSQPVCDAALLFLGLVVASSPIRARFSTLLNGGLSLCYSPTPLTWDFAPSCPARAATGPRCCGLSA